ncbi:1-deoxy-D-xylulose-5-phosphate reductoisomerase [Falsarthrobacter nasiphocae]|uniref:1-deoxy-D-xylulose 5-phosphate reductoisomerase n=1 Tax=Falsarthrobacter nasiphocae TaxID=189863 RepID=A0AAE4C5T5_9MICC|nr:1-deoxy-D-xylulose-5-phosphate reductoisomerase [Falsarthrobacter nasiphocae]MDR6892641.1 1-deoxy-D-xylulose-5-phosphate reductoisomerase [Falsarthrobacter nasiphocae]
MTSLPFPGPLPRGARRTVAILGSTGSIGTQALDVIRRNPDAFEVVALAAGGSSLGLLGEQVAEFGPRQVAVARGSVPEVRAVLEAAGASMPMDLGVGEEAVVELAGCGADVVLNGMTGSIGLRPTLAALRAGSMLALANKESLIVGGRLVVDSAAEGQIVPVDSEHSALAQALRSGAPDEVERLVVTASGGPFRGYTAEQLRSVTPAQALAHPTWDMGRVVTTNSASMVNKALEVIEAHYLFGIPLERIDVAVHPQSMVHSMVEFVDGSTMAQVSPPDMRLPIALGLAWPHRVRGAVPPATFAEPSSWTFEPLDESVFPAVQIAKDACRASGTHLAVFNAANEEAVDAFHEGRISFPGILEVVRAALDAHSGVPEPSLEDVLAAERDARRLAQELITRQGDAA